MNTNKQISNQISSIFLSFQNWPSAHLFWYIYWQLNASRDICVSNEYFIISTLFLPQEITKKIIHYPFDMAISLKIWKFSIKRKLKMNHKFLVKFMLYWRNYIILKLTFLHNFDVYVYTFSSKI